MYVYVRKASALASGANRLHTCGQFLFVKTYKAYKIYKTKIYKNNKNIDPILIVR